jgi:diphthine synthase
MGSVTFIGLGLNDEKGMTLEALEEARRADSAFAEFYTNIMPNVSLNRLEELIGKKVKLLNRTQLEDEGGRELLTSAQHGKVVFFVPGDPMIATTHISLRLSMHKIGIRTRMIHAASIVSAICGATGLQSYKFGKSITVPRDKPLPISVLETMSNNSARGLHTLLLLDVSAQGSQLKIGEAAKRITEVEPEFRDQLVVGAARVGAPDEKIKAGRMSSLVNEDFGDPPHSMVLVGKLHFMEIEALKMLSGATEEDLREYT